MVWHLPIPCHTTPLTASRDNQAPCRLFRQDVRPTNRSFLSDGSQSITWCSHRRSSYSWFPTWQVILQWYFTSRSPSRKLSGNSRHQAHRSRRILHQNTSRRLETKTRHLHTYNVKPSEGSPQTKRQILSEVTRILNLLGLLSPIVNQLKSFTQALWLDQLSWDDSLNQNLSQKYQNLRQRLQSIEEVQILRCVLDRNTPFKEESPQLYVFCDASITAYDATVYIRQPIS